MDLDLRYFFDGMQSKEQSASAFLAALLAGNRDFRAGFFAQLGIDPPLDPAAPWKVRVENTETFSGSMDVTLEDSTSDTFVLIENKISPWSKAPRPLEGGPSQLLWYYLGASEKWPARRVIAVYLAPDLQLGADEVSEVSAAIAGSGRPGSSQDAARAISWPQVSQLVRRLPDRGGWFGTSGMDAVERAIAEPGVPLPPDEQRRTIRGIVANAYSILANENRDLDLGQWKTKVGEVILVQNAPVTLMLTVRYDVDLDTARLGRVVMEDGRVRVQVITYLGLPRKRVAPSVLKQAWGSRLSEGSVEIGTLGRLPSPDGRKIEHVVPWEGTQEQLRDLLVDRGRQAIEFLRPLVAMAR